jgi:hypothetical protein
VIPCAFAAFSFGAFAIEVPGATWLALAGVALSVLFCLVLHGGIVVSDRGIEWYAVHPRWRYRFVPWDCVLDVRKSIFGLQPIHLIVKHGRYEPWVWGRPRRGERMDIEIWSIGYAGGDAIWDAVRSRSPKNHQTASVRS